MSKKGLRLPGKITREFSERWEEPQGAAGGAEKKRDFRHLRARKEFEANASLPGKCYIA